MASSLSTHLELGCSLTVPNVQELASTVSSSAEIPKRYFRPEVDNGPIATIVDEEIPAIDFMKLLHHFDEKELSKLGTACREWGFFQLINHGISKEVVEKAKEDIMEFFRLSLKEKEVIKQLPGQIEGYGQMFVHSDEQRLDWADVLTLVTQPHQDLRFWPTNPITFRNALTTYTSEIDKIVHILYRNMAKELGVDPEIMLKIFNDQMQSMRINYYPPCKQANKVLGLSPHSDGIALTVLLQANEVNGLQIKKNGNWFLVKPKPGAFIINIGDMLEIITNGKYKSIEHRVVVNMEEERLSIAAFHLPNLDVMLNPLQELVNEDGQLYKAIRVKDYTKEYFAGKLNGKNALESMKLYK